MTVFESQWDGEPCLRVYGSPDIPADKEITIALPRKRPFNMTMNAMKNGASPTVDTGSAAKTREYLELGTKEASGEV